MDLNGLALRVQVPLTGNVQFPESRLSFPFGDQRAVRYRLFMMRVSPSYLLLTLVGLPILADTTVTYTAFSNRIMILK
jgi:hypothetical protein